jgi:hypothetical protein
MSEIEKEFIVFNCELQKELNEIKMQTADEIFNLTLNFALKNQ